MPNVRRLVPVDLQFAVASLHDFVFDDYPGRLNAYASDDEIKEYARLRFNQNPEIPRRDFIRDFEIIRKPDVIEVTVYVGSQELENENQNNDNDNDNDNDNSNAMETNNENFNGGRRRRTRRHRTGKFRKARKSTRRHRRAIA